MSKIIFNIFLSLIFISEIQSVVFTSDGKKPPVCFKKYVKDNDKLTFSFVLSTDSKQTVNVELKEITTNTTLYFNGNIDKGHYRSNTPLKNGIYRLCFFASNKDKSMVSMEFYTLYEDSGIKALASDNQVKNIGKDIQEITSSFQTIVTNAKYLYDRRWSHLVNLRNIIGSIKIYTVLKFVVVAVLSGFQVYVIKKFFGEEKRVSNIKGGFSNDKNEFL